ncbi:NERD domain-containing protein [Deinococcus sp. 14RED07]|uniref:NERD domain-containing protein n=1 Tax=Deinococcus sp. 14RED07 TaxID=2745874 RepID=UPI001E3D75E9|nr:nuclease-related domain-containing DEAD/DEAH box helicase [Deinococcus sp. 14RED07]MCD0175536.1 NERD domain-containing protein [Deinococcus sp. 14RED07]
MSEFIVTESAGDPGEYGELQVIDALRTALRKRDTVVFWRYPLNTRQGQLREPDLLLLDPEWGVVVIEVKNIPMSQVESIQGFAWRLRTPYFGKDTLEPYDQAKRQARVVIERIRDHAALGRVPVRALVCLPRVTRDEWTAGGQSFLFSDTPLVLGDELTAAKFEQAIEKTPCVRSGAALDDETFRTLLSAFGTGGSLPAPVVAAPPAPAPRAGLRKIDMLARAAEQRREFDLQQERIAKTIPPGVQRIRGIAGSGKTVLLAQKAANMHLRHPEWDIALVFFCRALYEQMQMQVDHWLRVHSNGQVRYVDARHRIRILHAWGSRDQPGFYRTVAEHLGLTPMNVTDVKAANGGRNTSPTGGVVLSARELLTEVDRRGLDMEIFDAVLIDEGQDLVDDDPALRYEDRQSFYWMAYRSLRPVQGEEPLLGEPTGKPPARRLIWAYDEAQSLDSLTIPTGRELFGEKLSKVLTRGTSYRGGIAKNEVMRVCYRTPGPILVAAHALGMGLMRPEGMVAGLTDKESWGKIGYTVEGDMRTRGPITITRPPEHSPNLIARLDPSPLIDFRTHTSRNEELAALTRNVRHALEVEGLSLDRQLVICLGRYPDRTIEAAFAALRREGLDVYVAGNLRGNVPPTQNWREKNPNGFRLPGHLTVTNVTRAKGNEADMVHIVGLDEVAAQEGSVTMRNQLFVALSRSRGWIHLSGTGVPASFREEVEAVLRSGESITFTMSRAKRNLTDQDDEPEVVLA